MDTNRYDVAQVVAWKWIAPRALDPDEVPSVTFERAGQTILSTDLTPIHGEITLTGYGTDTSKTEFIASEDLEDTSFLGGEKLGKAFIYTAGEGWFPVEVVSAAPGQTSVFIGSRMPRVVTFPATLQWATYLTEIGPEDVTESASRNILWRVQYEPLILGGEASGFVPTATERGRIIVARAFNTGLDTAEFFDYFPEFIQKARAKDNTFDRYIQIAHKMLIREITCAARAAGKTEDELFGEEFKDAHAYLTAYFYSKHNESEAAKGYLDMAKELIRSTLDVAWLDSDGNNQVDSGEEGGSRRMLQASSIKGDLSKSYKGCYQGCYPYYWRPLYFDCGVRGC